MNLENKICKDLNPRGSFFCRSSSHNLFFFSFVYYLWFSILSAATKISLGKLNGFASRMEAPNKVVPAYWKLDFRTSPQCEDQTEPNNERSLREISQKSRITIRKFIKLFIQNEAKCNWKSFGNCTSYFWQSIFLIFLNYKYQISREII